MCCSRERGVYAWTEEYHIDLVKSFWPENSYMRGTSVYINMCITALESFYFWEMGPRTSLGNLLLKKVWTPESIGKESKCFFYFLYSAMHHTTSSWEGIWLTFNTFLRTFCWLRLIKTWELSREHKFSIHCHENFKFHPAKFEISGKLSVWLTNLSKTDQNLS